uniref:Acidic fibroblast growth factor intracellular-binding protein-like n=2 Tax=Hirondellea gigas TaxID=1518452 RepID=A0A6A7FSD2_9CRUS
MNYYQLATKNQNNSAAMLPEVAAIVENFTDIDENVYDLWLRGLSVVEAVTELLKTPEVQEWGAIIPPHTDLTKIVAMDTNDHYRIFYELEKVLMSPQKLSHHCTHQISVQHQKILIERFYALDDCVAREIVGKKLSGRNRKDLDDVADKTGVLLRSCRRQFDNIKRVFKQVEETSGSLVTAIQSHFLLTDQLSRKYAAIVFLLLNRFETSKRKLNYVTFEDLYNCAFAIIDHWSNPVTATTAATTCAAAISGSVANGIGGAAATVSSNKQNTDDTGIDRDFLIQLRDLKCLMEREKEHKSLTLCELRKLGGCSVAEAEATFKQLSRPLCTIAVALHTQKELRDLFVDLVERVVDPVRTLKWNTMQLSTFLSAFTLAGALLLDSCSSLRAAWENYMKVISICVIQLHHF